MKFCDAMDKLKEGFKVSRQPWVEGVYFLMQEGDVKSFQPKLSQFIYNEDIRVSDGWVLDSDPSEYSKPEYRFCDIILSLKKGSRAKLKDWTDSYIYFDPSTKSLVIHTMEAFPFIPDFASFDSEDWVVIE